MFWDRFFKKDKKEQGAVIKSSSQNTAMTSGIKKDRKQTDVRPFTKKSGVHGSKAVSPSVYDDPTALNVYMSETTHDDISTFKCGEYGYSNDSSCSVSSTDSCSCD